MDQNARIDPFERRSSDREGVAAEVSGIGWDGPTTRRKLTIR